MSDAANEREDLEVLARHFRHALRSDLGQLRHRLVIASLAGSLLKRGAPLLPYAATAAAVALLVVLLRRSGAPPALIAAGAALDAVRIWALRDAGR